MAPQQTITGELRKWQHSQNKGGDKCVIGHMYSDINAIYDDGEECVIFYKDWVESANFYLAVTNRGAVKCPKDEEIKHAVKTPGSP